MKEQRRIRKLLYVCAILLLSGMLLYSGFQVLQGITQQSEPGRVESKTITRDGIDYFPRQDITVFLVMGIDQLGKVEDSNSYNNHGAADMVALLVFDEKEQVCNVLQLNRDTMLDMPVIGVGGKPAGSYFGQLALSHTYGSGLEDSCENTKKAVSDLLYKTHIDYYVAMNMDAIGILNDAVGGVTVTVTEDFSQVDPTIGKGQVTLMGEQAINYVRTRKDVGDQLNITRMDRHTAYMESFLSAFQAKQDGSDRFAADVYEDVADYLVSDCSVTVISQVISRYADYTLGDVITPKGENVLGETYFEFYADEEDLDRLILDLFFAPKR